MILYRMITVVVSCLGLIALGLSCGGSGLGNITLQTNGDSIQTNSNVQHEGSSISLKKQYNLAYCIEGCPTADGFTVVPMESEDQPYLGATQAYSIRTENLDSETGPKTKVTLTASENTPIGIEGRILAHLRFDPAVWQVSGVGSLNAWPEAEDFLSLPVLLDNGVLQVASIPVDGPVGQQPNGDFAEVFFEHVGTSKDASFTAPGNQDNIWCIWDAGNKNPVDPQETIRGSIQFFQDGTLGEDANSMDPTRDGDVPLLNGTGQPEGNDAYSNDNLIQSAIFSGMGATYNSDTQQWSSSLLLSFSEQLTGDHDNNGEVNFSDMDPIGQLMPTPPTAPTYYSPRGVHQLLTQKSPNFVNLYTNMNTPKWYRANSRLCSFWYMNFEGWTDPPGSGNVVYDPIYSAVDSNWDGFVYDWYNWDADGNPSTGDGQGREAIYDEPGLYPIPSYYHPGDVGPIGNHMGEVLSGYRVVTIPSGQYQPYNPVYSTLQASGVKNVATFYRYSDTSNISTWPYLVGTDDGNYYYGDLNDEDYLVAQEYPEHPWEGTGLDRFRKAELEVNFDLSNFSTSGYSSPGDYPFDVLVVPYYYEVSSQALHWGPLTRFEHAFYYRIPNGDPTDYYGPAYRPDSYYDTPQQLNDDQKGIKEVLQSGQKRFSVTAFDADDLGASGTFSSGTEQVLYYVYAMVLDATDPEPTASELFIEDNLVLQQLETMTPYLDENQFSVVDLPTISLSSTSFPLVDQLGSIAYFGVRTKERASGTVSQECEYDIPSDRTGANQNTHIEYVTVSDMTPPYFVCPSEFYNNHPEREPLFRAIPQNLSVVVGFFPAYDPISLSAPEDVEISYRINWTTDENFDWETGELPPSSVSVGPFKFSDYFTNTGVMRTDVSPTAAEVYRATIDNLGYGERVYFRITAIDQVTPSGNEYTYDFTYQSNARQSTYPGQVILATGLSGFAPDLLPLNIGSLFAMPDSVELVYPSLNVSGPSGTANFGAVNLRHLHIPNNTIPIPGNAVEVITDPMTEYVAYQGWDQSSISPQMEQSGDYSYTSVDSPKMAIAYNGASLLSLMRVKQICTVFQDSSGNWPLGAWHQQVTGLQPISSGPVLFPYQYYTTDTNQNPVGRGQYFLSWIFDAAGGVVGPGVFSGDLRYKDILSTSMWNSPTDSSAFFTIQQSAYLSMLMSEFRPDIIVRDIGRPEFEDWLSAISITPSGGPTEGGETGSAGTGDLAFPLGNRLYMLANSRYSTVTSSEDYFPRIDIWWCDNPNDRLTNMGSWNSVDFVDIATDASNGWCQTGNPNTIFDADQIGPNSLEVVGNVTSTQQARVYVAFNNELPLFDCSDSDNRGLCVASAMDSGSGLPADASQWVCSDSGSALGVVDNTYFYPAKYNRTYTAMGISDVVDLRKNPTMASASIPYSGLGCAYIHPSGALFLSETGASASSWTKRLIQPADSLDKIDEGNILWVKLCYSSSGTPYVLFARDDDDDNLYDIVLWTP